MEKNDFMAEVNDGITRILQIRTKQCTDNKENITNYCNVNNLEQCLQELRQEFDYFDVSALQEPIDIGSKRGFLKTLIGVVNSSFNLIQLQRETQKKLVESLDKNTVRGNEVKMLNNTIVSLRKDIAFKDNQFKIQSERHLLDKIKTNELKWKFSNLKKELSQIQKENILIEKRHKHELQKIYSENQKIEKRFVQKCGPYISTEGHIVNVVENYKTVEKNHLAIIEKLQENNHQLLEEILNLKGEITEVKFKYRSKD